MRSGPSRVLRTEYWLSLCHGNQDRVACLLWASQCTLILQPGIAQCQMRDHVLGQGKEKPVRQLSIRPYYGWLVHRRASEGIHDDTGSGRGCWRQAMLLEA